MKNKKTWFWVVGNCIKGFYITTKKPRHKHINEPFESNEAANHWIADQWVELWDKRYEKTKPQISDFATTEAFNIAYGKWDFEKHMFKPNALGYFRANND